MDLQDLYKVDNRKRLNVETEKLREKVSHETAKIIKLKVAQDTAYWDLKEKLQQVEGNHEKLQQNMVEVQMQHETISGQYQEELRLRPEILNKVSSTREICEVLEEYSERLKGALARCRADLAALAAAYERSGHMVQQLHETRRADAENNRTQVAALQERVGVLSEQQRQLLQQLSAAQEQARAERGELRAHAAAANTRADHQLAARHQLERDLGQCTRELEEKKQMNSKLEADIRNFMKEFNKQATEAAAVFSNQNKEIKELKEENVKLKEAVHNQEQFTKSISDQNNVLQERIATLEDERLSLMKTRDELLAKNEEATNLIHGLQNNVSSLHDEKQVLLKNVQETQQVITDLEEEIKNLEVKHTTLESEKSDVMIKLNTEIEECYKKAIEVETLTGVTEELAAKVSGLEAALETNRIETEKIHKELNDTIKTKNTELDSKATTINKLMSEVKKLEDMLQRIKKEMDIERDGVKEKETKMINKIGHLETTVADKEDQLSKLMTIIQEMRNDKERLMSKLQSMQSAMDNIQKQLSRPRTPLHFDDNARFDTLLNESPAQFAAPRAPEPDELLLNLFSDTSVDDDAAHVAEMNRRFNALARGERLSPVPPGPRQRGGKLNQRHNAPSNSRSNDGQVSLSQLRTEIKNKKRKFFKNTTRQ